MIFRATFFLPIVLLALALVTAATSHQHHVRQDGGANATPALSSNQAFPALTTVSVHGSLATPLSSFTESSGSSTPSESPASASESIASSSSSSSSSSSAPSSSISEAPRHNSTDNGNDEPSPSPSSASATATDSLDGSTLFNATIPAGQLPLAPKLTPGWGVAGVVMLTTGLIYTLVGIKNQWVHTFFSTAYMTALGIAVLIMYVMSVPVSNAVQGGFVVAVVVSGCLVGAASMFFKELTEGLGCALGGFCISMWLLCLVPGGLLHPVAAKAIFIAAFTVVGFGFYFSRWTRDWALIMLISFAGATITVLGIDCFSRAGLKEFWVYIWNINNELFPLGANTYPVTKGIRVETTGIVIIFLMGIISQIKLWRIVREKRHQRAVERAEGQRTFDIEEAAVGRQVEEANARDRRQWERVYGNGTIASSNDSRVSDLGDISSEKRLQESRTESCKPRSSLEVVEMGQVSDPDHLVHGPFIGPTLSGPTLLMSNDEATDSKFTVRVGVDDVQGETDGDIYRDMGTDVRDVDADVDEKATAVQHTASTRSRQTFTSRRVSSQAQTMTEAPAVVPLPFVVPVMDDSDDTPQDGRSSVATFAEDPEALGPERQSFYKRLSRRSASLLRSISQPSGDNMATTLQTASSSSEELVIPRQHRRADDDDGSLAATVDMDSMSGGHDDDDDDDDDDKVESRQSIEILARLSDGQREHEPSRAHDDMSQEDKDTDSKQETTSQAEKEMPSQQDQGTEADKPDAAEPRKKAPRPKSGISVSSTHTSLTKEKLPASLSKIALSYRTNEWAKHLSYADLPDPDDMSSGDDEQHSPAPAPRAERTAPLDAVELQKTAQDGAPQPAMRRCESQSSMASAKADGHRRWVRRSASRPEGLPTSLSASSLPQERPVSARAASRKSAATVVQDRRTTMHADAIPEEPLPMSAVSVGPSQRSSGVVSYASPQTLLGQRELFLRNKSQGSLVVSPAAPASDSGSASPRQSSITAYPPPPLVADPDDLPLSQRRHMMRQSTSLMSLPLVCAPHESSETLAFNSHQPKRASALPSASSRQAQLASFRQSVMHDLRAGTPVLASHGRETPFNPSSLLANRDAEVQRNIEMQRNVLIGQKEAEALRRDRERQEKETADRIFDERMRNGNLIEAHREAMRKMQRAARDR